MTLFDLMSVVWLEEAVIEIACKELVKNLIFQRSGICW